MAGLTRVAEAVASGFAAARAERRSARRRGLKAAAAVVAGLSAAGLATAQGASPDANVMPGAYRTFETTASVTFTVVDEAGTAYFYATLDLDERPSAPELVERAQFVAPVALGENTQTIGGLRPSPVSESEPENEYAIHLVVLPARIDPDQVPADFPVVVLRDVFGELDRDLTTSRDTTPSRFVGVPELDASDFVVTVLLRVDEESEVSLLASRDVNLSAATVEQLVEPAPALPLVENAYEIDGLMPDTEYVVYISLRDLSNRFGGLSSFTVTTAPADQTNPTLSLLNLEFTHDSAGLQAVVDEPATLYYLVTTDGSLNDADAVRSRAGEATTVEVRRRDVGELVALRWPEPLTSVTRYRFYVAAFDKSRTRLRSFERLDFDTPLPPLPPPTVEIVDVASSFNTITLTFRSPDGDTAFGVASEAPGLPASRVIDLGRDTALSLAPNVEETLELGGLAPGTLYHVHLVVVNQRAENPNPALVVRQVSTVPDPEPEFRFGAPLIGPRRIEEAFSLGEDVRWWARIAPEETPLTVEQVVARPGRAGRVPADSSQTVVYAGLDPDRAYLLWYVADDGRNPPVLISRALRTLESPVPVLRVAGASGQNTTASVSFYADRPGQVFALLVLVVSEEKLEALEASPDLETAALVATSAAVDVGTVRAHGVSQSAARGPGTIDYHGLIPALRYVAHAFLDAPEGVSALDSTSLVTAIRPAFERSRGSIARRYARVGPGAAMAFVSEATHGVLAHNNTVRAFRASLPAIAYHRVGECDERAALASGDAARACVAAAAGEDGALALPPGENPLWWRAENFGLSTVVSQTVVVVPTVELTPAQTLGQNDPSGDAVAVVTARMSGPWVGDSTAPIAVGYRIERGADLLRPASAGSTGRFTFEDGATQASVSLTLDPGNDAVPGELALRLWPMPGLSLEAADARPSAASRVFVGQSSQHVITTVGQRLGLSARIAEFRLLGGDFAATTAAGGLAALELGQAYRVVLRVAARGVGLYETFCSLRVYRDDETGAPVQIGSQTFCATTKAQGETEFVRDEDASEGIPLVRVLETDPLEARYDADNVAAPAAPTESGLLEFEVRVVPVGYPQATVERRLLVPVSAPLAPGADADADGVGDADEPDPLRDADADGIPNFADRLAERAGSLQTDPLATTSFLTVSHGLRLGLGPIARWTAEVADPATYAPLIDAERVRRYQAQVSGAHPTGLDLLEDRFGVFDYEITGLQPGDQAAAVLPLPDILPDLGRALRLYKYRPDTGWAEFDASGEDAVRSLPRQMGGCPHPDAAAWRGEQASDGLAAAAACLRLAITDGGPNDADGFVDGRVGDPAAIVLDFRVPEPPPPPRESSDKGYIVAAVAALGVEELATRGGCVLAPPGARRGVDAALALAAAAAAALAAALARRRRAARRESP